MTRSKLDRRTSAYPSARGRLVAAALVAGCLALSAASASARTVVVRYTPFTATGEIDPAFSVTHGGSAMCTGSNVTGRSDAWRCYEGSRVSDPCFGNADSATAVCPRSGPWSASVVILDASFDTQFQGSATSGPVWALTTATRRCAASSGAGPMPRGGHIARYYCDRSSLVWGSLDRRRATWRALVGGLHGPLRWQNVRTAWR
jgi:hypothetical protein